MWGKRSVTEMLLHLNLIFEYWSYKVILCTFYVNVWKIAIWNISLHFSFQVLVYFQSLKMEYDNMIHIFTLYQQPRCNRIKDVGCSKHNPFWNGRFLRVGRLWPISLQFWNSKLKPKQLRESRECKRWRRWKKWMQGYHKNINLHLKRIQSIFIKLYKYEKFKVKLRCAFLYASTILIVKFLHQKASESLHRHLLFYYTLPATNNLYIFYRK